MQVIILNKVIKIGDLTKEQVMGVDVREEIKLESSGGIVNGDYWDIPEIMDKVLDINLTENWSIYRDQYYFEIDNRVYTLCHGNTRWFTLIRLEDKLI